MNAVSATDFQNLVTRKEKLCPELCKYICTHDNSSLKGLPYIHHPFIIEPLLNFDYCGMVNERFRQKTEQSKQAFKNQNWSRYIFLHERPYRIDALMRIRRRKSPGLAKLIHEVWMDSENIQQNKDDWTLLWRGLKNPHETMCPPDLEKFNALPEEFPVYRGIRRFHFEKNGMSWTTNRNKAIWFANRFKDNSPYLLSGQILKEDVLAYFCGRGENEIVAFPERIYFRKEEKL